MSPGDIDPPPERPRLHTEAVARRGRWPGIVWAIPIAALLVVSYLAVQAVVNHGVTVVVTFKTSGGARAGETPVVYKGVTVGLVTKIKIAANARDVEMTLRLDPRSKAGLREGAKFWLIGAEPTLTDLSSLKAVVSGVSIGVAPGAGAPAREFIGLDQPPAVPPDTPGALYKLDGHEIGSTSIGSGIYYHGLLVGRVTRIGVPSTNDMRLVIFVNAPFDRLVKPDSLFFIVKAADIALTAGHVVATIGPGSSVLTGGIAFDTPAAAANETQSPAGSVFRFFQEREEAAEQPRGPQVRYRARFQAAASLPQPNAPVFLSGLRIGQVLESRVSLPANARTPVTDVSLEIEPEALGLPASSNPKVSTDQAIGRLVRSGYRLEIAQSPPLVGSATLVLQRDPDARNSELSNGSIPTAASAGLEDIAPKLNAILEKVNAVPIVAIGQNVRRITESVQNLVTSPKVADSLDHLDSTLAQADAMMRQVRPQIGPLTAKLNQAADQVSATAAAARGLLTGEGADQDASLPQAIRQLDEAARSIRALADELARHPESLIQGRKKERP